METRTLSVEHSTSTAHRLLYYDGACNYLHGHNLHWDVSLTVDMSTAEQGTNMPLDLKDIKETLDVYDHTTILNSADPLVKPLAEHGQEVITVDSDPTCERVVAEAADWLLGLNGATSVTLTLHETDSYAVTEERSV